MKAFSHINIGEKISFIIGCKNYLILVVSKKTDIPCANCTRPCAHFFTHLYVKIYFTPILICEKY